MVCQFTVQQFSTWILECNFDSWHPKCKCGVLYHWAMNDIIITRLGQCLITRLELQLSLDRLHCLLRYLQVAFLLPQESILICKYDCHKHHSQGGTPWVAWLYLPSSLALCTFKRRVLNYSISSLSQLAPNTIITCSLKSCWTQTLNSAVKTGCTVYGI